ncbi:dipeptide ABC transporter ATP-binding protein [Leucobacter chromiireducens]|uniref:ABC transporter ATP-binding protein n=1 Tax=Leucobacter chromiireducens subsp. chromiireducens TaxID=660067 RepID=A0ABS1SQH9_9MICO|nr:ABC transporter ATP-binding protein [Leucobacter chromiireducens]MBL3690404.1 ABC transporter ATP-binding protein [Leucobacter chromiireducens subsp. chromiireducens]
MTASTAPIAGPGAGDASALPLEIDRLTLNIDTPHGTVHAVNNVSLSVEPGEILAIVGESGSGKTLTARAVLGLFPPRTRRSGVVLLSGEDVLTASPAELRELRGNQAAMIFQEPSTALNPVFSIGWQLEEGLRAHGMSDRTERRTRAIEMLRAVGIPEPERRLHHYPHQFSGGQKQRIVIAMALALRPKVIIADEPTTALDVTVQAEILDLLRECRDQFGASIVLITHNMGVVADLADRVAVMYRGDLVEEAPVAELFANPREEYTQQLLAAVPRLGAGGRLTDSVQEPSAAPAGAAAAEPEQAVTLSSVDVVYTSGFGTHPVRAVRGVDLTIARGEVLGLVGESGSGKSTIGRAIGGLETIGAGSLRVFGAELTQLKRRELRALRRRIGFVFQDPAASFNSFMTVEQCIAEPMRIHRVGGGKRAHRARAIELLDAVELPASYADRYPFELSGGQRQRVGLARALALGPELVIADEPTSALDVSVQAKVLDIFSGLQRELGFASLFISHDLAVVEMLAHRVGVLRQGELVEIGPTERVLHEPQHEYTQRLIAAVPVPDPAVQRQRRAASADPEHPILLTEEPA